MSTKSSAAALEYLMAFIKSSGHQKASKPGFAHALKLSYNMMDKDRFSISSDDKTLTYRYLLSDSVLDTTNSSSSRVGLYTALMDELSTDACVIANWPKPSPPGVSLHMKTELMSQAHSSGALAQGPGHEVDVINHVTKLGKTVSHMRTDFVCGTTQKLLAYSSHIKYMPTGSIFLDLLLRSKPLSTFYQNVVVPRQGSPPVFNDNNHLIHDVIGSNLQVTDSSLGKATFTVTKEHTNGFGGMHGGCHAMVMEQVGTVYAIAQLFPTQSTDYRGGNNNVDTPVVLEAMNIDFLAAAGGTIDIGCDTIGLIGESSSKRTIHVRVVLLKDRRILSEGNLRFSTTNR